MSANSQQISDLDSDYYDSEQLTDVRALKRYSSEESNFSSENIHRSDENRLAVFTGPNVLNTTFYGNNSPYQRIRTMSKLALSKSMFQSENDRLRRIIKASILYRIYTLFY